MSAIAGTSEPANRARPRISVVMPTYQRRDLITASVVALTRQTFTGPFEVVVTVDGSTDGTAEALRRLVVPFPLLVLEQPNAGASVARNRGAEHARGEILLFLDDDMEADSRLLEEHDRCHREGSDAVLGHMPLHPESPATAISAAVGDWAEDRLRRLSESEAELTLHDLLTGQMSVSTEAFRQLGGFDTAFTRGGSFGNEDVDFGLRLLQGGFDVRFNGAAISRQRYVVTARQHLRQWRQAGRADVLFARKYPAEGSAVFELNGLRDPFAVRVARPLAAAPLWSPITWPVRTLAARVGDRRGSLPWWLFIRARTLEYWRGVREAGGIPGRRTVRVLCYHAIANLKGHGTLEPYGVPIEQFRRHLSTMVARGFRPLLPREFDAFVEGRSGVPRRAVLFTFDDGYADLADAAEVLRTEGIGALAFVVSGLLGQDNAWDRTHGGPPMPLLDAPALRRLRDHGVDIGGHSRTHALLPSLEPARVEDEIRGCIDDLEALGLGPVHNFAYPYGEEDEGVRKIVRESGLGAAFTVRPGVMRAGSDPLRIPRVEILRADDGLRFLAKVFLAREIGWLAFASRRTDAARSRIAAIGLSRLRHLPGQRSRAVANTGRMTCTDQPAESTADGSPPGHQPAG